jgi:hypothetical protein
VVLFSGAEDWAYLQCEPKHDFWDDSMSSFIDARIERFRLYQTRCNICGKKRDAPGYAHYFVYGDQELQCCDLCMPNTPTPILRKEYWDRIYGEPDAGHPLWRYVELPKFLDTILFKRIWFTQVRALDDSFEGALGAKTRREDWRRWMHKFFLKAVKNPPPGHESNISGLHAEQEAQRLLHDAEAALSTQKTETYVNCWHVAKHESFLMWKVYANNRPDSVCIKTNLIRIRNCLERQFRIGVVQYIDFRKKFPDVNWPFLFKRAAFLQENEARIFVRRHGSGKGFYVDIDPGTLIDEVLVSPDAPPWLVDNIKRVIDLSGTEIRFRISDLNEEPF